MKSSNAFNFGRVAALSGLLALGGCGSDSDDAHHDMSTGLVTKTAILTGAQQNPAVTTNAVGYGSVVVDPMTLAITGSVTYTGMAASGAHIHTGATGTNSPVGSANPVTLVHDNVTHTATVPAGEVLTQQEYADFLAGNLYFNVHSNGNSSGEIRGQIGRVVMKASLDGTQAGVTTTAAGTATFVVDPVTKIITGSSTFTGVTATGAHIHRGGSGARAVDLDHLSTAGTATVPAATMLGEPDYKDLLAGKLYVNIHSGLNTGGEIRGQIGPVAMVATLDGEHQVPAVTTTASGKGVFVVDPLTRALSGGVVYKGMTPTSAHIHVGAVGTNSPAGSTPPVTLTIDLLTFMATVPANTILTQQQYDDMLAGSFYVNVHSTAFPAGEIRGQVSFP